MVLPGEECPVHLVTQSGITAVGMPAGCLALPCLWPVSTFSGEKSGDSVEYLALRQICVVSMGC